MVSRSCSCFSRSCFIITLFFTSDIVQAEIFRLS
jgi:hypothetical protein